MKEHINLHTNVLNSVPGKINDKTKLIPKQAQQNGVKPSMEDLYDSLIERMDFSTALGFTGFLREQSLSPEGREKMGLAHNPISHERVMQMF